MIVVHPDRNDTNSDANHFLLQKEKKGEHFKCKYVVDTIHCTCECPSENRSLFLSFVTNSHQTKWYSSYFLNQIIFPRVTIAPSPYPHPPDVVYRTYFVPIIVPIYIRYIINLTNFTMYNNIPVCNSMSSILIPKRIIFDPDRNRQQIENLRLLVMSAFSVHDRIEM